MAMRSHAPAPNTLFQNVYNIHDQHCEDDEITTEAWIAQIKSFFSALRHTDIPRMYLNADVARYEQKPLPDLPTETAENGTSLPELAGDNKNTTGLTERQERALYLLRDVILPQVEKGRVEAHCCSHTLLAMIEVIKDFGPILDTNGKAKKLKTAEKKFEVSKLWGSILNRGSGNASASGSGSGSESESRSASGIGSGLRAAKEDITGGLFGGRKAKEKKVWRFADADEDEDGDVVVDRKWKGMMKKVVFWKGKLKEKLHRDDSFEGYSQMIEQ